MRIQALSLIHHFLVFPGKHSPERAASCLAGGVNESKPRTVTPASCRQLLTQNNVNPGIPSKENPVNHVKNSIMQNKPKFQKVKFSLTRLIIKTYSILDTYHSRQKRTQKRTQRNAGFPACAPRRKYRSKKQLHTDQKKEPPFSDQKSRTQNEPKRSTVQKPEAPKRRGRIGTGTPKHPAMTNTVSSILNKNVNPVIPS